MQDMDCGGAVEGTDGAGAANRHFGGSRGYSRRTNRPHINLRRGRHRFLFVWIEGGGRLPKCRDRMTGVRFGIFNYLPSFTDGTPPFVVLHGHLHICHTKQ